jgi:hypothetical protein
MRRVTALVIAVLLLPAFALAPFTHVHVSGHGEDRVTVVHSHFSPHSSPHAAHSPIESVNENDHHSHPAFQVDLFQFLTNAPLPVVIALPTSSFVEPQVEVLTNRYPLTAACSHDPPLARSPSIRAPPVMFLP